MRTYVLALIAVACLGLSACGSDDATHDAVPSSLPELTPPPGAEALAKTSTGTSSTQSADSTSTDQTDTTSTDQTQTQGQAPAATTPSQTTTQAPAQTGTGGTSTGGTGGTGTGTTTGNGGTGGVSPGEFSQFCKDNPGAC
jgi:hypothetical protein